MKKRVLVVCPDFFEIGSAILNAVETNGFDGMKIEYADVYPQNLFGFLFFGIFLKARIGLPLKLYDYYVNRKLIKMYTNFVPDILIVIKGNKISRNTLNKIDCKKHLWLIDSFIRTNISLTQIESYDFVHFMEEDDYMQLKDLGNSCSFVPNGYDNNIYYPIAKKINYDIVFVGQLYSTRITQLKKIIDEMPNLRFKFVGGLPSKIDFFKNYELFTKRKYRKVFSLSKLLPKNTNLIYNSSKIVFNPHFNSTMSGTNMRFFEINATNSIQLTNEKYFISNRYNELVITYSSEAEIINQLTFIINNFDNCRKNSILAGEKTLLNETFASRIKEILSHE